MIEYIDDKLDEGEKKMNQDLRTEYEQKLPPQLPKVRKVGASIVSDFKASQSA